jgi:hypothetical protein
MANTDQKKIAPDIYKLLLSTACIFLLCQNAYSGPLDELAQSPEMIKFDKESKIIAAQSESASVWFKPGSNLEKIFASSKGAQEVISWIDTSVTTWRKSKFSSRQRPEYLMTQVHYHNTILSADVDVTILIPHPRYQEIVNLKLVKDFTDLEPPAFKPVSDDLVNIQGNPGHAYLRPQDKCSLVIKVNHDAVVNVESDDCNSTSSIIAFAKSLNISRLNRKLDS